MTDRRVLQAADGRRVEAVTLSAGAVRATVVTPGAALQDLRVGDGPPCVLGFADPLAYLENGPYLGALVGRVANRIAGASAVIDGARHRFDANEAGTTTLHGGHDGLGRRIWQLVHADATTAVLRDTLPDGHMGFPGRLEVEATWKVDPAGLQVTVVARSDAPTLCSIAPHVYFGLSGSGLADHRLRIAADRFLPTERGVPIAGPEPVAETRYDLRAFMPVPDRIDLNYCLSDAPAALRPVAELRAPGRMLRLLTTEPGLQVYDGGGLDVPPGKGLDGRGYGPRSGVALEPQRWPDAPNRDWRAQTDLRPGDEYRQVTRIEVTDTSD